MAHLILPNSIPHSRYACPQHRRCVPRAGRDMGRHDVAHDGFDRSRCVLRCAASVSTSERCSADGGSGVSIGKHNSAMRFAHVGRVQNEKTSS